MPVPGGMPASLVHDAMIPRPPGREPAGSRDGRANWPALPAGQDAVDGAGAVVELVVEVDGRVDQGQVAERLREVAELLAGDADLLGVQAHVVGVGMHLLEGELGLL